jgi:hypothetical protein
VKARGNGLQSPTVNPRRQRPEATSLLGTPIIWLGRRTARFGIRGHWLITVREFERAIADLEKAATLWATILAAVA